MDTVKYCLAIDIGASSGRHIICHIEDNMLITEEVYRFENNLIHVDGHDRWDIDMLYSNILAGMKRCAEIGKIPVSVGIDTWGLDFVLVDTHGRTKGAISYRDTDLGTAHEDVAAAIPFNELYARTGIQYQSYNTIYRIMDMHSEEELDGFKLLLMPDYFNYLLCGRFAAEYTNASTTSLVNAETKQWDYEVIRRLGLHESIFCDIIPAGAVLGHLKPDIIAQIGYDCIVILPATHDTGSAFLSVPARDENAVYISSGTWSLLGVENDSPIVVDESRQANFSNEGGYLYRFRFLKNIMGLWIIQSLRRELNGESYVKSDDNIHQSKHKYTPDMIASLAREATFFPIVDINDESFFSPKSMIEAICDYCDRTGQNRPQSIGELALCIYEGLAQSYARSITELEHITGKKYTSLNIVGGGSKDELLCELTARHTGLPVYAGPSEGTAIGNIAVQLITLGEIDNLQAARDMIRTSFDVIEY